MVGIPRYRPRQIAPVREVVDVNADVEYNGRPREDPQSGVALVTTRRRPLVRGRLTNFVPVAFRVVRPSTDSGRGPSCPRLRICQKPRSRLSRLAHSCQRGRKHLQARRPVAFRRLYGRQVPRPVMLEVDGAAVAVLRPGAVLDPHQARSIGDRRVRDGARARQQRKGEKKRSSDDMPDVHRLTAQAESRFGSEMDDA